MGLNGVDGAGAMGIESEEGLLKSGGAVPKRSSGSVSVPREPQRAKICGVQSEKEAMRAAGKSV